MKFRKLQTLQREWSETNFIQDEFTTIQIDKVGMAGWCAMLGVVEEVGELSHSLLKQRQNIRGTYDEHETNAKDAVGDIVIFLADLCNRRGWDLEECVQNAWNEIKDRDWVKYPEKGKEN